jgi:uncharacterized lipoprotein YmbA
LPRYLRRNEIVTRVGASELRASDTHRWGEDLDCGLERVVAENLAVLVPAAQVGSFPWRDPAPMDYRVSIEVQRFERTSDGAVTLEARWAVFRGGDAAPTAGARTRLREENAGLAAAQ